MGLAGSEDDDQSNHEEVPLNQTALSLNAEWEVVNVTGVDGRKELCLRRRRGWLTEKIHLYMVETRINDRVVRYPQVHSSCLLRLGEMVVVCVHTLFAWAVLTLIGRV